jgi:hypothetical protein
MFTNFILFIFYLNCNLIFTRFFDGVVISEFPFFVRICRN